MADSQKHPNTFNPVGSVPLVASQASKSPPDEFSRFEDLTSKLVNVPKHELDEQRETESQREKDS